MRGSEKLQMYSTKNCMDKNVSILPDKPSTWLVYCLTAA